MQNWQIKKLGEICTISIGKTPSRANNKFWDVGKERNNIWLSIRDLNSTVGRKFLIAANIFLILVQTFLK